MADEKTQNADFSAKLSEDITNAVQSQVEPTEGIDKSNVDAISEAQDENVAASGRPSRPRKNSTPSTPVSTPPTSRQITPPPPGSKHSTTPSPSGSTASKTTPTPSPAGSNASSKQSGAASTTGGKLPGRVGIQWKTNSRVEAKDFLGKWYPAKILEVDSDDITVLIHFEGWNSRYDEWIRMDSDRLRPSTRHSERKEKREKPLVKAHLLQDHKVNECVFAKWTDCRMYAARIIGIKANGAYEVVFYDGFKKAVQPINIKPMPPDVQEQYGMAGWLPPPIKKNKVLKREDLMAPKMREEALSKHKNKEPSSKKSATESAQQPAATATSGEAAEEASENAESAAVAGEGQEVQVEGQDAKVAKRSDATKDTESATNAQSASTEKKKEIKMKKVNISKSGVKTKEVIRSRLQEVQKSKVKHERSGSRSTSRSERSDKSAPSPDKDSKKKSGSPSKHKKLKIGGGFMFQTKRARIDALTAKINKAKEERRHSAPPSTLVHLEEPQVPEAHQSDQVEGNEVVATEPEVLSNSEAPVPVTATPTTVTPPQLPVRCRVEWDTARRSYLVQLLEDTEFPAPLPAQLPPPHAPQSAQPPPPHALPPFNLHIQNKENWSGALGVSGKLFRGVRGVPLSCPNNITSSIGPQSTVGKKKSLQQQQQQQQQQELSITMSSGEQATMVPLIPKLKGNFPKKAFKVEEDHNRYKCPLKGCDKGFRKPSLVDYHVKYYHTSDGTPVRPPPPRKRRKTTCGGSIDETKRLRRERGSLASLSSVPDTPLSELPATFDDTLALSEDGRTSTTEETLLAEQDEETVSCDEFYDKMEDEDFVSCICQINEENGLMIQCDVCLCWQHAVCMEITQETLPKKYVCYVCNNPPGARDSARFIANQDWHREGALARFDFLPVVEASNSGRQSPCILATHNLVGDVHNVNHVLHGLRRKMAALSARKGKEFNMWTRDLDKEPEEPEDVKVTPVTDTLKTEPSAQQAEITLTHAHSVDTDSAATTTVQVKIEPAEVQGEAVEKQSEMSEQSQNVPMESSSAQAEQKEENSASEKPEQLNGGEAKESSVSSNQTVSNDNHNNATEGVSSGQENESHGSGDQDTAASNGIVLTSSSSDDKNVTSHVQPSNQSQTVPKTETPGEVEDQTTLAQNNLLRHIMSSQDVVDARLDDIEQQLTELETLEAGGVRPADILRDIPALKKAIHNMSADLAKVKRMARFH